jgi:hypothetical protein
MGAGAAIRVSIWGVQEIRDPLLAGPVAGLIR